MKEYFPAYYNKFSCLAGRCPDTCCAQWEIVIDGNSLDKYKNIKGEFGDKIRNSLIKDDEGDYCFILKDGRCPFLNSKGLCDIHINCGESYTSDVCKAHPRFYEEYDGFTEISLSLSCPEACKIISSYNFSENVYPTPLYNGDDSILTLLIESRRYLFSLSENTSDFLRSICEVSADDQCTIDGESLCVYDIYNIENIILYLQFINKNTEILTEKWKNMLEKALGKPTDNIDFVSFLSYNESCAKNITAYFLYRYYLKAVNDCDIFTWGHFISFSVAASCFIAYKNNMSLAEAARMYSKEIEHDTVNIELITDYLREGKFFI